jgi:hypothetical protein
VLWSCAQREHGTVEHQAGEGDEVQARHRLGQPLVVLGRAPKPRSPREGALHHPPARHKSTKPFLAPGCLTTSSRGCAARLGLSGRLFAGVAAVHVRASSTDSPVASCTASTSAPTCARSCSVAGVTTRSASRWPRGYPRGQMHLREPFSCAWRRRSQRGGRSRAWSARCGCCGGSPPKGLARRGRRPGATAPAGRGPSPRSSQRRSQRRSQRLVCW